MVRNFSNNIVLPEFHPLVINFAVVRNRIFICEIFLDDAVVLKDMLTYQITVCPKSLPK